jgi:hypothetical protein
MGRSVRVETGRSDLLDAIGRYKVVSDRHAMATEGRDRAIRTAAIDLDQMSRQREQAKRIRGRKPSRSR